MAKKKKVNPNRIPVTQADINRAKDQAMTLAMERILNLVLFILIDKHDAPKDDIQQLAREIDYYADSIREGRLTWKDVERVVRDEYETKVCLR